ncbi:unnamed protein product [Bursaphelenchus okinawaensis]|uniref:CWH43-like N-terminal domain-containing protein n=1 Tax=Bursaphelenchus okinawaensis TaxID=465554 RepID=A0A811KDE0_9BILA|nr:unnamed protein product [Bursaphelenchus okinawaensis]CAG9101008.1 unnamed protein product [Bursaphelenchus okinawaensis]
MVTIWTPIFPLLCCLFCFIGIVSGYAIGVALDHLLPVLPIISEGGILIPERGVFGTFINYSAVFWFFTNICLYLHMKDHVQQHKPHSKVRHFLYVMLFLGIFSGFGFTLLANFQLSEDLMVHGLGAIMMFFGGLVFFVCYIVFTLKERQYTSLWMTIIRMIIIVPAGICVFLQQIFNDNAIIVVAVNGTVPPLPEKVDGINRIGFGQPWWLNHLVSSSAEWTVAFLYLILVGSLAYDLLGCYIVINLNDYDPRRVKRNVKSSDSDQHGKGTDKVDTKSEEKDDQSSYKSSY